MAFAPSEPPKHRRIRKWMGATCSAITIDAHKKQPVYMSSAGAYSVQAVQGPPRPPSIPSRHQQIPTTSLAQAHPRPTSATPQVQYADVAQGNPPPTQHMKSKPSSDLSKFKSCSKMSQSVSNVVSHTTGKANATILELEDLVRQSLSGGKNGQGATSQLLNRVITLIDCGFSCGRENELASACVLPSQANELMAYRPPGKQRSSVSTNYFSKVYYYANSRMPPNLPSLKFYPATYPLLRLAARFSRCVYEKPCGRERQSYVSSDWRQGTKAMVIKSLPLDDMNTIVFAIRGTQSFMDWAVNVHTAPVPPTGFLDDPSNCCHAGFLSVARKMVGPVAVRLRTLIEEDPSRMSYSLMVTGHSAGGAVAGLLYLHLLSESPQATSELTHLRGCFKHIYCVTFGAPPVSLRPLTPSPSSKRSKSMFFAFINEGDPVTRADKGYFFSLLDLYVSPAPGSTCSIFDRKSKSKPNNYWRVPPSTLSNAGRLVLLRGGPAGVHHGHPLQPPLEAVASCGTTDAELRGLVFGDAFMHEMDLYARRIEILALAAPKYK